jgi:hypothetical protein
VPCSGQGFFADRERPQAGASSPDLWCRRVEDHPLQKSRVLSLGTVGMVVIVSRQTGSLAAWGLRGLGARVAGGRWYFAGGGFYGPR